MDALKTGKIISNARKKLNMTQKDLASKLFVSDKAVSKWERGLSFPDISVLIPISDILNINLYDLLNGDETGEKKDDAILKDTINYSNKEDSPEINHFNDKVIKMASFAQLASDTLHQIIYTRPESRWSKFEELSNNLHKSMGNKE